MINVTCFVAKLIIERVESLKVYFKKKIFIAFIELSSA